MYGGIGIISTTIIAPLAYSSSWVFVAFIVVARFLINQCPFFLEVST
jgi:hypothetical protein